MSKRCASIKKYAGETLDFNISGVTVDLDKVADFGIIIAPQDGTNEGKVIKKAQMVKLSANKYLARVTSAESKLMTIGMYKLELFLDGVEDKIGIVQNAFYLYDSLSKNQIG